MQEMMDLILKILDFVVACTIVYLYLGSYASRNILRTSTHVRRAGPIAKGNRERGYIRNMGERLGGGVDTDVGGLG